ncbi:hypothetical protein H9P43_001651 [Blastocladiella emersonii ATCC 22665]|nr:hypothetical protein H9P43_001651 [Blastocladiella emersonii ATCC 22665]
MSRLPALLIACSSSHHGADRPPSPLALSRPALGAATRSATSSPAFSASTSIPSSADTSFAALSRPSQQPGWCSARNCAYPQWLVFSVGEDHAPPPAITAIQLLAHNFKIPSRVSIQLADTPSAASVAHLLRSGAGDPAKLAGAVHWIEYGHVDMSTNAASNFRARELKTIPTAIGGTALIRLVLHGNYHNDLNLWNQVSLLEVRFYGHDDAADMPPPVSAPPARRDVASPLPPRPPSLVAPSSPSMATIAALVASSSETAAAKRSSVISASSPTVSRGTFATSNGHVAASPILARADAELGSPRISLASPARSAMEPPRSNSAPTPTPTAASRLQSLGYTALDALAAQKQDAVLGEDYDRAAALKSACETLHDLLRQLERCQLFLNANGGGSSGGSGAGTVGAELWVNRSRQLEAALRVTLNRAGFLPDDQVNVDAVAQLPELPDPVMSPPVRKREESIRAPEIPLRQPPLADAPRPVATPPPVTALPPVPAEPERERVASPPVPAALDRAKSPPIPTLRGGNAASVADLFSNAGPDSIPPGAQPSAPRSKSPSPERKPVAVRAARRPSDPKRGASKTSPKAKAGALSSQPGSPVIAAAAPEPWTLTEEQQVDYRLAIDWAGEDLVARFLAKEFDVKEASLRAMLDRVEGGPPTSTSGTTSPDPQSDPVVVLKGVFALVAPTLPDPRERVCAWGIALWRAVATPAWVGPHLTLFTGLSAPHWPVLLSKAGDPNPRVASPARALAIALMTQFPAPFAGMVLKPFPAPSAPWRQLRVRLALIEDTLRSVGLTNVPAAVHEDPMSVTLPRAGARGKKRASVGPPRSNGPPPAGHHKRSNSVGRARAGTPLSRAQSATFAMRSSASLAPTGYDFPTVQDLVTRHLAHMNNAVREAAASLMVACAREVGPALMAPCIDKLGRRVHEQALRARLENLDAPVAKPAAVEDEEEEEELSSSDDGVTVNHRGSVNDPRYQLQRAHTMAAVPVAAAAAAQQPSAKGPAAMAALAQDVAARRSQAGHIRVQEPPARTAEDHAGAPSVVKSSPRAKAASIGRSSSAASASSPPPPRPASLVIGAAPAAENGGARTAVANHHAQQQRQSMSHAPALVTPAASAATSPRAAPVTLPRPASPVALTTSAGTSAAASAVTSPYLKSPAVPANRTQQSSSSPQQPQKLMLQRTASSASAAVYHTQPQAQASAVGEKDKKDKEKGFWGRLFSHKDKEKDKDKDKERDHEKPKSPKQLLGVGKKDKKDKKDKDKRASSASLPPPPMAAAAAPAPVATRKPEDPMNLAASVGPSAATEGDTAAGSPPGGDDWNIDYTCVFCEEVNPDFTQARLDLHFWQECPMLSACPFCREVVEVANLPAHVEAECPAPPPPSVVLRPDACALCGRVVGFGEQAFRAHLLQPGGCPRSTRKPRPGVHYPAPMDGRRK